MKRYIALVLLADLSTVSAATLTLKESFEAARLNMESIKRADAVITQSEEQKIQARAFALPTISGVGSYTKIDQPEAAGSSPFLLTRQYSAALRLTQPLIRGGIVSGYEVAKENILLANFQKDATEVNLYQLVINAYYNLNIAQVDLKNIEELEKLSRERVKELRERTAIGRSRKGELIEAEAVFHNAESQYQQGLIALQQAEKTFEYYTRMKAGEIVLPAQIPELTGTIDEYMSKVKSRPDVLASVQQTKVATRLVDVSKAGHYPTVDLISNYYFDRTGVLATSEWDIGVAVVIPLFQGGGVQAGVREAVEVKRIAELNGSESRRTAERDVAIIYQNIKQLQLQLKTQKMALAKAEEAYRVNKKDYTYGLVPNLDVLQSLNFFIQTKRSYDGLVAITHLNYKSLEAATGVLP